LTLVVQEDPGEKLVALIAGEAPRA
jgi:hypothetical protein